MFFDDFLLYIGLHLAAHEILLFVDSFILNINPLSQKNLHVFHLSHLTPMWLLITSFNELDLTNPREFSHYRLSFGPIISIFALQVSRCFSTTPTTLPHTKIIQPTALGTLTLFKFFKICMPYSLKWTNIFNNQTRKK